MSKKCLYCKKEFTSTRKEASYCSHGCYLLSRIGKIFHPVEIVCKNCKKPFYLSKHYASKRKYCSAKCREEGMHGINSANWRGGDLQRVCSYCNKQFFAKRASIKTDRGKFCSKQCFDFSRIQRTSISCPTCGNIRELRASEIRRGRIFCSQKCYRLNRVTSIEKKIRDYLTDCGIVFIPEYSVGRWSIDIFIPSINLAIECDGEYWHRNTKDRDARKDNILKEMGINVLRLSESEIRDNMEYCKKIINSHLF